jgi:predicted alpha/beta superfamily hydrolase
MPVVTPWSIPALVYLSGMKLWMTWACVATVWMLHGQVVKIQSVPGTTPPTSTLYWAGALNGWNPGSPSWAFAGTYPGPYHITLPAGSGSTTYKITRGSWPTVEGNATGGYLPNRTYTYGLADTVVISVASWEDLGSGNSTATANVQVVSPPLWMASLQRPRTIRVYLPPGYDTSAAHYPVMYLLDGQNLFDAATAFAGEWEVDESLNALAAQGWPEVIAIGIDNGGTYRTAEYTPWAHPTYGGGDAALMLDFMTNQLKPWVDSAFRTQPGREATAIGGSSLGGLFCLYAALEQPQVYSKALVFSPSIWFSDSIWAWASSQTPHADMRLYFLTGTAEGNGSVTALADSMVDQLLQSGWTDVHHAAISGGTHSEGFWAAQFPNGFKYLFGGGMGLAPAGTEDTLYPNPTSGKVYLPETWGSQLDISVWSAQGQRVYHNRSTPPEPLQLSLPPGIYFLHFQNERGQTGVTPLVIQ